MAYTTYKRAFSHSEIVNSFPLIEVNSQLNRKHGIIVSNDLFSPQNSCISEVIQGREALFIISKNANKFYGKRLKSYLENKKKDFKSHVQVLPCGEERKYFSAIESVCEYAAKIYLNRQSPIVAVGGGICMDVVALAAGLFRRGVPHIKIPTTLVGLIDAGIGIKNGINFGTKKNLLGLFLPPEYSLIDSTFIKTLPERHIRCGLAEIIKMGIVVDNSIFTLVEKNGYQLISSRFQSLTEIAVKIIRLSIVSMMTELTANIFEIESYERAVDFGHTFSPYIESCSDYKILHGEAVAIDMAITCQLAYQLNILSEEDKERILNLFLSLNLPIYHPLIKEREMWESLNSIVAHRGGKLNLVVPQLIGKHIFLDIPQINFKEIERAIIVLKGRNNENWSYSMVS